MKIVMYLLTLGVLSLRILIINPGGVDEQAAVREVIDLYRQKIEAYCEKYSIGEQLDIQEYLLTSQTTDFSSDIPGLPSNQINASDYFIMLKQQRIQVEYAENYDVRVCGTSPPVYGVIIDKKINTSTGETYQYKDYIEVHLRSGDEARIFAIASSRYSEYLDIECIQDQPRGREPEVQETGVASCNSFAEAEEAKAAGSRVAAIRLYENALECGYREDYIRAQLDILEAEETTTSLLEQAEVYFQQEAYTEAISYYELLQGNRLHAILDPTERELVRNRLAMSLNAIEFKRLVASGDYLFNNQSYTKAQEAYYAAVALRPADKAIATKLAAATRYADGAYRRQASKDIREAIALLKRHHRYNGAVSVTLMKYANTGWLSGQELFYLIQLLDANPREVKKSYSLSQREVCVRIKLLLRQAAGLGFDTQAFRIFRKDHLNNRSKNCQ